jgi:ATP-dependent exoDNAse (exonuclease V) alpha subunit
MQLEHSDCFDFQLKPQQIKAFQALTQFANSLEQKVFILRGYAGTGKTSLMSGYIKFLDKQKIPFKLLASTGRASKILSDKTNTASRTIHSLIYRFRDLDDDLEQVSMMQESISVDDKGQLSLVFDLRAIDSSTECIYIIDEASMVADDPEQGLSFAKYGSGKLLYDLVEYDKNGKFVFVGDPCQLPPVGQDLSPALSRERVERSFNITAVDFELTEIHRQAKNSGIVRASMLLRDLQRNNPMVKWAKFPFKGFANIHLHSSHVSLINAYINTVKQRGFEHASMICQTNRHCFDINAVLRKSLGRNDHVLKAGDILLVTQNSYLVNLVNGDLVEVLDTGDREYRAGLGFLQVKLRELASKMVYNVLLVEDVLLSKATNLNHRQHKSLYIDYYKRMLARGIHQKDSAFKEIMLTDPYLNALKAVYGYALTCHKGQGGEWEEVFLYLDNKIQGLPRPGIYQWVYTAVTRARQKLHVVNDWFVV